MVNWERHWYRPNTDWFAALLLPLSWLFQGLVSLRRFFYQVKIKKTHHFSVPVIVVGNITVGGTGKTPFVIWLAQLLKTQGFRPGIVSRGVGGKQSSTPRWITMQSDVKEVGDEALLLARCSLCPVVIATDRVAAVKELLLKTNCNIVLSDDGLQHYRLGRRMEILLMDSAREWGNQHFLPAGPLRESVKRVQDVDFVVKQASQLGKNQFYLTGQELVSLQNHLQTMPLLNLAGKKIHAVAAIGNPQRFFDNLRAAGLTIVEHVFPDHHLYQEMDFQFTEKLPIVMTEKDAVKCEMFSLANAWFLPVKAVVDEEFEKNFLIRVQHDYVTKI